MRRRLLPLAALLFLAPAPAPAQAQSGGAPAPEQSGGAAYGAQAPVPRLSAREFTVSPGKVAPGAALTVAWRIDGPVRAARVRVELLPAGGGKPVATLRVRRSLNHAVRVRWRPRLKPGAYRARLHASAVGAGKTARVSVAAAARLRVVTPPAPTPAPTPPPAPAGPPVAGVFPIQGAYTFGGADARFGAQRTGHIHQGQDLVAAAGVPVVSPRAGTVHWRAYQAGGAGHYVVVRSDDGRDYVFMHLLDGSVAVEKGQSVAAGQRLGLVGSTGSSDGPHLHFEIWPDGWYAEGSHPIDPLPDLQAWAAAASG
jgi:murein DD-endopeptidase MepM/ murein hydrolase activator NlpD